HIARANVEVRRIEKGVGVQVVVNGLDLQGGRELPIPRQRPFSPELGKHGSAEVGKLTGNYEFPVVSLRDRCVPHRVIAVDDSAGEQKFLHSSPSRWVTRSELVCFYGQRCPTPARLPLRPDARPRYADA